MTAGFSATFGARRRSRGVALVVVLWTLLLLSLIAAGFIAVTRTEVRLARNALDNARAEALADAGVYRSIQELLEPKSRGLITPQMENLLRLGTMPVAVARRKIEREVQADMKRTGDPRAEGLFKAAWPTDGSIRAWPFAGGEVRVSIQDEGGKIDLNTAPDALLRGLFRSVGLDRDATAALVDAIADFRDEDDLRHLNGAETSDYRAAGLPHGAKNAAFEAVAELRQVMGMTPALYETVSPALTVHSGQNGIDPRVAPEAALLAAAAADAPVEDEAEPAEDEGAQAPAPMVSFQSISRERVFTIRAEAHTDSDAVFVRKAIVELINEPGRAFRVHAWKQGRRRP